MPELADGQLVRLGVADFVALVNQTFEYAFGSVAVVGELANFRVSKNRWVYFDLKDEAASVRCFGTVYSLPGPLEDGMVLEITAQPRLHPQFGFSLNFQSVRPVGEGVIKKAAQLLQAKLQAEGLFDPARKRPLPYPPERIGLITSVESAAYADFIKIVSARWQGMHIQIANVQVQGEPAPAQIIEAIQQFNQLAEPPEALVLIRGGGNADDLQAFSTEQVVRAVAGSRIPTLVAIGHEVDTSLAELAADRRASTPSNAAETLVPDRQNKLQELQNTSSQMNQKIVQKIEAEQRRIGELSSDLSEAWHRRLADERRRIASVRTLLTAYDPATALKRGYALVRGTNGRVVRSSEQLEPDAIVELTFGHGSATAHITDTKE